MTVNNDSLRDCRAGNEVERLMSARTCNSCTGLTTHAAWTWSNVKFEKNGDSPEFNWVKA